MDSPRLPVGLVGTVDASVYLKTGESAVECHGTGLTLRQVHDTRAQVEIVAGLLGSYAPDVRRPLTGRGAPVTPV